MFKFFLKKAFSTVNVHNYITKSNFLQEPQIIRSMLQGDQKGNLINN